jgi:hypothetical protein
MSTAKRSTAATLTALAMAEEVRREALGAVGCEPCELGRSASPGKSYAKR